MKTVSVRGDFVAAGVELGRQTKSEIEHALQTFRDSFPDLTSPTVRSTTAVFLSTVSKHCPNYVKELQGIAAGADVPFDQLFLLNIEPELTALLEICPPASHDVKYRSGPGCTNVYVNTLKHEYLVHTEDVPPDVVQSGCLLQADITSDVSVEVMERFTVYITPGILAGSTYGYNMHGLVHSHNNVFQRGLNLNGIPRRFLARMSLTMHSSSAFEKVLRSSPGIASGFTFLFRDFSDCDTELKKGIETRDLAVFEVAGGRSGTKTCTFTPQEFYHHCNTFQHLEFPHHPEESTIHRQALLSQYCYKIPNSKQELLHLLSDQTDPMFPMHRTGSYPDHLATGSTALFDFSNNTMEVYSDKPSESKPVTYSITEYM